AAVRWSMASEICPMRDGRTAPGRATPRSRSPPPPCTSAPAARVLERRQRPRPSLVEVDERRWIVGTQRPALHRRERPRLVDQLRRHLRQLRHPPLHVGALGVEALALAERREDAGEGLRVGPRPRAPPPVASALP